ncbi:MAG: hypothetical protein EXQ86_00125 [Rhodospirillales bacterium]|nr:hypothetical protein [Rhodospirillales bacterium]
MALKMGTIAAAALSVLLAVATLSAHAQEREVRRITQTDATSDCIGDPRTPLCALETYLACVVRKDRVLCDRVDVPEGFYFGEPWQIIELAEYLILDEVTLTPENIPEHLKDVRWMQPGMVEIRTEKRACWSPPTPCRFTEWAEYDATVEHVAGSWRKGLIETSYAGLPSTYHKQKSRQNAFEQSCEKFLATATSREALRRPGICH